MLSRATAGGGPVAAEKNLERLLMGEALDTLETLGEVKDDPIAATEMVTFGTIGPQGGQEQRYPAVLAQFWTALEKLSKQRELVLKLRVSTHEKRNQLRQYRENVNRLEGNLFRILNLHRSEPPKRLAASLATLSGRVKGVEHELQEAKDEYGALEDDYNQLENQLDVADYKLHQQEQRFYQQYARAELDVSYAGHSKPLNPPLEPSVASTDGHEASAPLPPILEEFYSRLGDANLLKERLTELLIERSEILDEESRRKTYNIPLPLDHAEFWKNFDQEWFRTQDELSTVEAEVEELRQRALDQGLLPPEAQLDSSSDYSMMEAGEEFESLVQNAEADDRTSMATGSFLQAKPISARRRVEFWLISVMEASPHEMRLFLARTKPDDPSLDEETYMHLLFSLVPAEDEVTGHTLPTGSGSATRRLSLSAHAYQNALFGMPSRHDGVRSLPEWGNSEWYETTGRLTGSVPTEHEWG